MITILGFLKANKNAVLGFLVFCIFVYSVYNICSYIYDSGYKQRTSEYEQAYILEVEKQQKEYEIKLEQALKVMQSENQAALDRQDVKKEIAIKTEKVIQYVDKIIVKDECANLASDVVWLLSESTATINNEAKRTTKADYKF